MKKELLSHKLSYSALFLFLATCSFLFLAAWPDVHYQRYIVLLISVFYFLWGVVIHLKRKELSKKIVFEYFGISLLAGSVLMLITL